VLGEIYMATLLDRSSTLLISTMRWFIPKI